MRAEGATRSNTHENERDHAIERRWLWLVLGLSVLARVAVALYLGNVVDAPPLLTDQRSYHALGERLLGGHGFSFDRDWYPFTLANTPTAHWSFLYSLFVAAVYALLGVHPVAVRLVQAVLGGLLIPWMVYRLAQRAFVGRRWTPLWAAAVAAGYAYLVLYAATLMTETFYIVLLLWSLNLGMDIGAALQGTVPVSARRWLGLGLVLGLATLMRQSILPWLPFFFLWLLWQSRASGQIKPTLRGLILAGLMVLALVLPWTVRNYAAYGRFLLLNSNTGYAMYSAQHPMHGTNFSEFAAAPLPEGFTWGNEAAMDRELLQLGIRYVLAEPGRYLLLCLSRVRAFVEFWPSAETSTLHNLGRVVSFGLALPFMIYGLILGRKRRILHSTACLVVFFVLVYSVMHIMTWAMVRYRLPVDATLLPLAALGAEDVCARVRLMLARRGMLHVKLPCEVA